MRELTTFLWTGFETADPGQFRRDELDRLQIYTVGDVSRLCVWFLRPRDAIKLLLLAQSDRSCKERLAEARRFVGIFNQEDRQAFGPCAEDILHRLQRLDVVSSVSTTSRSVPALGNFVMKLWACSVPDWRLRKMAWKKF